MALELVTRAQWGANYTSGYYTVNIREKDEFFVHYHGGVPSASVGVWVPRNVEAIHHANGWSGVGYSFVVDQAGTLDLELPRPSGLPDLGSFPLGSFPLGSFPLFSFEPIP